MNDSSPKRTTQILLSVLILAGVFYAGFYAGKESKPPIEQVVALQGKEPPQELSVPTDFSTFWNAWLVLNNKFVPVATTTRVSDAEKVWGAISGLVASLKDPYTVFLPPEEKALFEDEINGNFQGVGMEIGVKDDTLTVIAPLKGTPAERAGIRSGDKILKIGNEVSAAMKVEEAVKRIRGPKGTSVNLTISREGVSEPIQIAIVREVIDIPTIDTEMRTSSGQGDKAAGSGGAGELRDGVFVIRLYNFSANAPRLFRDALRNFSESGSHKLLLDLRGNPGGFLEAAVDIASWFLPPGKVVVTENFGEGGETRVHRSRGYDVFNPSLRMVILVNGGSASASEILAGALREHGIAKLVGTKTFGKGSVQELISLTSDTSLKVTVARWLTPNGVSISDGGLAPDIEVKITPEDIEKEHDPQMERAIKLLTE